MNTDNEHYGVTFQDARLDPYRILQLYGITHPAQQHAIKKLLRAGRSVKTVEQDVREVIQALERWLEMMKEDQAVRGQTCRSGRLEDDPQTLIKKGINPYITT
jgi:hypothetical protein